MRRLIRRREALMTIAGGVLARKRVLQAQYKDDPFKLGVASGDPLPTGVVLWTRLAPDPLEGGGMPPETVAVRWRVASDERFLRVVRQGTVTARRESAHSVHVDVSGLEPARWYWYQFCVGQGINRIESPIGRTRTAPAANTPESLRFAFASCQKLEDGYFTAYRHMAEEELDLVVHLGDYIYEGAGRTGRVRQHPRDEAVT